MNFKKTNNITGWIVAIIACIVFISTREATASLWDCGEFISSAFKLQVPHPPGAPFFLILARLFIILTGAGPHTAASSVNLLSAVSSGMTILFLFWTITHFAKRLMVKTGEAISSEKTIAIIGAGVVGALAFTFTDSFWFSAVEGEVYALSAFFTAIIFWAALKWEEQAAEPHADRWIVFIAFMIGLSIGVHLLSILTIPAIVMLYYFKRYKATKSKTFWIFILSCIITFIVQVILIQYTVKAAGAFDIFFVNGLGLPFNSGAYFFLILLAVLIIIGLKISHKKSRYFLHLSLLCFAFILIGYSMYFTTLIRANAQPAINMNNVDNPQALVNYLDRSQYGTHPLLYGQYFTAQPTGYNEGANVYQREDSLGKYVVVGHKMSAEYAPEDKHPFPRIWDTGSNRNQAQFYRNWLGLGPKEAPTGLDNLDWFFSYQLNWMYWRYFMWNFSGRQNDTQGFGNVRDGNWITGIPFIDEIRLGDLSKMPESLKNNKAHNTLFALPFILGLIGLFFQYNRDKKNWLIVLLLFFFTGVAIVFYLNQGSPQPRERDYAFVGSFYAFAIWIGLGVLGVYNALKKKIPGKLSAVASGLVCLLLVPVIMGFQEWDDHDRSTKTLARDSAIDYLQSCKPNAILFTEGDNDTYPLWYAQEVEGIRTDVRVVNMSLLGVDWYIDNLRYKINDAAPLPISWSPDKYQGEKRNYIPYVEPGQKLPDNQYYNLDQLMAFMGSDKANYKVSNGNSQLNYFPTHNMFIEVNKQKAIANQLVPTADTGRIVSKLTFKMPKKVLYKNDLLLLNIIAANNWNRPIYFTSKRTLSDLGLGQYMEQDGLSYRLVPVKSQAQQSLLDPGNVNLDFMYENLMTKFKFGGAQTPGTYFDQPNRRSLSNIRGAYAKLGIALAQAGKKDSALKVLKYGDEHILKSDFPFGLTSERNIHNIGSMRVAFAYYLAGDVEKGNEVANLIIEDCKQQAAYYRSLSPAKASAFTQDLQQARTIISKLKQWKGMFGKDGENSLNKAAQSQKADTIDNGIKPKEANEQ